MGETIRCQHCGTFVPAEKAFCPNCSEPMEVEERPNRQHSFSSDMMSTMRDDPEKYREMLLKPPVKKEAAKAQPTPQASAPTHAPAANTRPAAATSQPQPQPPPPASYHQVGTSGSVAAPQSNSKRNFIFAVSAIGLLAVVLALLIIFKVF